jgi:hypothetical protein
MMEKSMFPRIATLRLLKRNNRKIILRMTRSSTNILVNNLLEIKVKEMTKSPLKIRRVLTEDLETHQRKTNATVKKSHRVAHIMMVETSEMM